MNMRVVSLLGILSILICASIQAEERPIVVIIPSYNNQKWCDKNVRSALNQKYSNFRIIYIDDCSTDNTANMVRMLKRKLDSNNRLVLLCNEKRCGALANIYKAVHDYCAPGEIVCTLDGDDWCKDDQVLATVNEAYANPNVWMTYGQFEGFPGKINGFCREFPSFIVEHNAFRDFDWVSSHLRTFYAGLFQKIRLQDLVDKGEFFDVTWDLGFMYPMLEMARERHKLIPRVLYVYNVDNPQSDFRIKLLRQWRVERLIRSFERYERIDSYFPTSTTQATDLIVVSDDNPERLQLVLQSVRSLCNDVHKMHALYCASTDALSSAYDKVRALFPDVSFTVCTNQAQVQPSLVEVLNHVTTPYVACLHDGLTIHGTISFGACVAELEKTRAHGFYLSLGADVQTKRGLKRVQKVPPLVLLTDTVRAWHLKDGEHDWRNPLSCSCAVYRTPMLKDHVAACVCDDFDTLQTMLATEVFVDARAMGLCYVHAPVAVG
ncbi:MAG: glycosyltransferase family 2 protein [Candidatus Babeliales bacterium]